MTAVTYLFIWVHRSEQLCNSHCNGPSKDSFVMTFRKIFFSPVSNLLCSSLAGTQLPKCPKQKQYLHFYTTRRSAAKKHPAAHSPAVLCTSASARQERAAGGGLHLLCKSSVLFTAKHKTSNFHLKSNPCQSLFCLCSIFSSHQLCLGSSSCLSAGNPAVLHTPKTAEVMLL